MSAGRKLSFTARAKRLAWSSSNRSILPGSADDGVKAAGSRLSNSPLCFFSLYIVAPQRRVELRAVAVEQDDFDFDISRH